LLSRNGHRPGKFLSLAFFYHIVTSISLLRVRQKISKGCLVLWDNIVMIFIVVAIFWERIVSAHNLSMSNSEVYSLNFREFRSRAIERLTKNHRHLLVSKTR
jgi:hypothetical protein